jgi:hypothetical protein
MTFAVATGLILLALALQVRLRWREIAQGTT